MYIARRKPTNRNKKDRSVTIPFSFVVRLSGRQMKNLIAMCSI